MKAKKKSSQKKESYLSKTEKERILNTYKMQSQLNPEATITDADFAGVYSIWKLIIYLSLFLILLIFTYLYTAKLRGKLVQNSTSLA